MDLVNISTSTSTSSSTSTSESNTGSNASGVGSDSSNQFDDCQDRVGSDGSRSRPDNCHDIRCQGCDDRRNVLHDLQLFVKTLNGKTVTVDTLASALVRDVKLHVQAKTGIPPHEQRLIFAGWQLEDERGVMASGVGEWGTLHLSLRLCGGLVTFENLKSGRKDPFSEEWTSADSQALVSHHLWNQGYDLTLTEADAGRIIGQAASDRKLKTFPAFKRLLGKHSADECADVIFRGKRFIDENFQLRERERERERFVLT